MSLFSSSKKNGVFFFNHIYLIVMLSPLFLHAQDYYWTGSEGDHDFFNESNWFNDSLGQSPQSGTINPNQPIAYDLLLSCDVSALSSPIAGIVFEPTKTLYISSGVLNANSFSGGTLVINEDSYVHLHAYEPLINNAIVDFNSPSSWLRLQNVTPNLAYDAYLSSFFINDQSAQYPINLRMDNYYDTGTVVRSYNSDFSPLTIYSDQNIIGLSANIKVGQIYNGSSIPNQLNNNIHSFYLKRGYMLTLAVNEDGTGKSKVFIASESDLEVHILPNFLQQDGVSFLRVVPWNWVSKKGTAGDISSLNNTWFYRWNNQGFSDLQREYTPMAWGYGAANDDSDIELYISKYKSTHVLGFNEPDDCDGQSGQYNDLCDVSVAISVYENLMKTGLRIASPACRQGAVFNWLNNFYQAAVENDIRIDVIAVHWYDWGSNPQSTPNANPNTIFSRFKTYLEDVYDLYGLPIWITEFNGNKYRSTEKNRQFMELAIPYLESVSFVERYAWFEPQNTIIAEDPGNAEFFDEDMNLTDLGIYYKNYPSTASVPLPYHTGANNLTGQVDINHYSPICIPANSLSIENEAQAQNPTLKVFPNPATDKLKILFSEPIKSINLYSVNGLFIKKKIVNGYIDISDLAKGLYFLSLNQHNIKFLKH
jgi:hypothetical protein